METHFTQWNSSVRIYYMLPIIHWTAQELKEQATHFTNTLFLK